MKTKQGLRKEIAALQKEYKQVAQTDFKAEFAALFEKYPDVRSVGWTQCTPYFNDGDTCTFSAHTDYPIINGHDSNYGLDEADLDGPDLLTMSEETTGWGADKKENSAYNADAAKAVKAVKAILADYSDEDYEEMFGDHVTVMVTRKGIKTSEYEHD